jgi:TonB-linked SusC/RagA family outer membrane protein
MKQQYQMVTVLLLFVLAGVTAFAQQKTVSGTVKDPEDKGMPGVNVLVKGTTAGTTTDTDGNFTIQVPADAGVLVFSFIGYASQEVEIGARTTIDVILTEDVAQLNEVVVTALGIQRERKALQYSATDVAGDNFTQARENNIGNALVGRIAGVNVSKVASGPAGSSRVIIRGNKTLGGQNQPLYVVDGVPMDNSSFGDNNGQAGLWGGQDQGNGLSSINPDDIESITVLKGAAASALYGARGGFGVINIVTKKGSARKGIGVDFSSNYVAETVMNLSDLQTTYGTGNYIGGVATKPVTAQEAFDNGGNSWGTRLDGSPTVGIDGVTRPYSYAGDNWDRFYRTGTSWTNSIAMTGGNETANFRLGISDLRSTSVVPNSGFDRFNATLSANAKLGKKLTIVAKMLYTNEYAKNRPTVSDSPGNAIQAIWVRPPNININDLRGDPNKLGAIPEGVDPALLEVYGQDGDPKFAGQELLPAANNWGQNPWWAAYQHINSDKRDRIITSGQLRYDITSWLYASGRIGMDWMARRNTQLTPEGVGYQLGGAMTEGEDRTREINMEWMLGTNKTFGKINVNAYVGGNKMVRSNERIQANGNGFNVPFQPFINNAAQRNFTYNYGSSQINSLFGSAEVSFNNYLFITATARNDWFSILNPEAKNNIFYPSVGASFVVSDAVSGLPGWLDFAKIRASVGQVGLVGSGLNPYDVNLTYSLNGNPHILHTMATFTSAQNSAGNMPNPDLVPATSNETEVGIEAKLFGNRIGLDLTFYWQKTTDDILRATISRSSGFGTTDLNVGELTNKGVEILLTGTPVRKAIVWDVSLNLARNVNKVVTLLPGVNELVMEEPRTRNVFIKQIVGQNFGTITGRVHQRTADGQLIYTDEGSPVASSAYTPIGNGLPKWTGGVTNSLSYKGFNLSALIDFKIGGDIFSGSNNRLTQWGLHKQSLIGRDGEQPLHIKGVVRTGGTDAAPEYTQVDRDLTPEEARIYWNNVGGEATGISEMFIYDATFFKLRQLTLGYTLPRTMLAKTPFRTVTISLVGRNLAILYKDIDNVDPESNYSANTGAQGLEYFGFPSTRSYGVNLNLGF